MLGQTNIEIDGVSVQNVISTVDVDLETQSFATEKATLKSRMPSKSRIANLSSLNTSQMLENSSSTRPDKFSAHVRVRPVTAKAKVIRRQADSTIKTRNREMHTTI